MLVGSAAAGLVASINSAGAISGTSLGVSGITSLAGAVTTTGPVTVAGLLTAQAGLAVTGDASLSGALTAGSLASTGAITGKWPAACQLRWCTQPARLHRVFTRLCRQALAPIAVLRHWLSHSLAGVAITGDSLTVGGTSQLNGVNATALDIRSGATRLASISSTGAITGASLSSTGAISGGSLSVTGTTRLAGAVNITAPTSISVADATNAVALTLKGGSSTNAADSRGALAVSHTGGLRE